MGRTYLLDYASFTPNAEIYKFWIVNTSHPHFLNEAINCNLHIII